MHDHDLMITCKHITERTREGEFRGEDCLCNKCWGKMEKLMDKYGEKVPMEKLDFVFTACQECVGI